MRRIKQALKHNRVFYRWYHYWRSASDTRVIVNEQREYEALAAVRGVSGAEDTAAVFARLRIRLAKRGKTWPPEPLGRPLHVLYASMPTDWEPKNIPPELAKIGTVSCFYLRDAGISSAAGWPAARAQVDRVLPDFVADLHRRTPIDFLLSYLSGAQVSAATIERISEMGIPTFSFHLDDRRFFRGYRWGDQWSGPAAVCRGYDLNLTNARASLVKYRCEEANALFWPPGANPDHFRPTTRGEFKYDVSFCGARYGVRPLLVDYLRKRGLRVDCFGKDWEHGYQSDEALTAVVNASRINLGFGYVTESREQCLKGRDFEIPACGAVYLTSANEDLARVYRVGAEIETYTTFADCADKIEALLSDPARCERLRQAARAAVVRRHSWAARVRQLLGCTGVPDSASDVEENPACS